MILNFTYKNVVPKSENINSTSRIKTKGLDCGNNSCLFRESEPKHKHNAWAKVKVAYPFWHTAHMVGHSPARINKAASARLLDATASSRSYPHPQI
jgi:hypothetical protein